MASLFFEARHNRYRVRFEYGGVAYNRSLGKAAKEADARAALDRVERTIALLSDGVIEMPADVADPGRFILSGGKDRGEARATACTLEDLFDAVDANTPAGAKEGNTLETEARHRKFLLRILGARTPLRSLKPASLQGYVAARAAETYRGEPIGPDTIRREISTFRACWNRGLDLGVLRGLCPSPTKGLRYPKEPAKPPFQTRDQIEAVISQGSLTARQIKDYWGCLFLRVEEVERMLGCAAAKAPFPFAHPMMAFVAYTGTRRAEMMRSRVEDIDFGSGRIQVREKKRDRSKALTFRHVEMAPRLARILREWLGGGHPGGPYTFCRPLRTPRKRRPDWEPLTEREAEHAFRRSLEGSEWAVVPGFHCLRHSFASNAAARGVPAAQIDAWLGHQTEQMRRRYQHLFPERSRSAIEALFGGRVRQGQGYPARGSRRSVEGGLCRP